MSQMPSGYKNISFVFINYSILWATTKTDLLPRDTVCVPRLAHHQIQRDRVAEEMVLVPTQEMTAQELSEKEGWNMPTQTRKVKKT